MDRSELMLRPQFWSRGQNTAARSQCYRISMNGADETPSPEGHGETTFHIASALSIGAALVFAIGVLFHVNGFNGPDYWPWRWIHRANQPLILAGFALAVLPGFAAHVWRASRFAKLALIAFTSVALQLAALSLAGQSPRARLEVIIRDPAATSYYTAARQLLDFEERVPKAQSVELFDRLLRFFPMHARTKPLLPVWIYRMLIELSPRHVFVAVAILIAVLRALAVPAMFLVTRRFADEESALIAATLTALMPGFALFYPQFDTIYPLFTCAVMATWPAALNGSRVQAAAFGLTVVAMSLMSYSMLVLGAFCVVLALLRSMRTGRWREAFVAAALALLTIVGAYGVIFLATGYDPVATFASALHQQSLILPRLNRHLPQTIPFDLLDFAFGMAWIPMAAALFFLFRKRMSHLEIHEMAIAGMATPLIVALSGLLQAENARVWLFLTPFVAFAAACEMRRWLPRHRLLAYAAMVVVATAAYANMMFLYERPAYDTFPRIPAEIAVDQRLD